ncbi:hypothetical protein [Nocardioides zeicaulis]|uniref:DUF2567 domain-containing protein n=1 Tax=Nocardioides zeicaulis TaxID=1776857 RepID=A0ABV6DWZ6_9ACTN
MSEPTPDVGTEAPSGTPTARRVALRLLVVVLAFLVAGTVAGVAWEQLWDAPVGLTYQGAWFLEPAGPDLSFQGVWLFVAIAFPLGIVLAVVAGLWREHETLTVVAVLVASCLASVLMYAVGHHLGPADPQVLAAGSPDYTKLPGSLGLTAPDADSTPWRSSALLALPMGAMAGLVGSYLLSGRGFGRRSRG